MMEASLPAGIIHKQGCLRSYESCPKNHWGMMMTIIYHYSFERNI